MRRARRRSWRTSSSVQRPRRLRILPSRGSHAMPAPHFSLARARRGAQCTWRAWPLPASALGRAVLGPLSSELAHGGLVEATSRPLLCQRSAGRYPTRSQGSSAGAHVRAQASAVRPGCEAFLGLLARAFPRPRPELASPARLTHAPFTVRAVHLSLIDGARERRKPSRLTHPGPASAQDIVAALRIVGEHAALGTGASPGRARPSNESEARCRSACKRVRGSAVLDLHPYRRCRWPIRAPLDAGLGARYGDVRLDNPGPGTDGRTGGGGPRATRRGVVTVHTAQMTTLQLLGCSGYDSTAHRGNAYVCAGG